MRALASSRRYLIHGGAIPIHPRPPHFELLSDWAKARGGYVTLSVVDEERDNAHVLTTWRWSVAAFVRGEQVAEACDEQINEAARFVCSELGIGAAA